MTDSSDFGLGASLNEITSDGFKSSGDINATAAELVYGTTIRLPRYFFEDTGTKNISEFVQQLKQTMHNLKPVPTSLYGRKTVFVHPELSQCTHVFLRHDALRKPLQSSCDGPFAVVKRSEKLIPVQRQGKKNWCFYGWD
ncbi:integrase catalytic domain-containing protein [Trichonephila inaurata madagascariensis]|uniref:Integrase catalytic domain-containing protein n=1 Tax=Trichonephila inaurata madagascariensis TaxID=2747483 RepID=A0A8X6M7S6_9ARAC|nr:integrase catalytic domain-containing protein [Trichonephila inaurata madagascariensis]